MGQAEEVTTEEDTPEYNYCAMPLASYACRPDMSKGRIYEENESATRSPFQRDRDRIIHASAFRRLKYKNPSFRLSRRRPFQNASVTYFRSRTNWSLYCARAHGQ